MTSNASAWLGRRRNVGAAPLLLVLVEVFSLVITGVYPLKLFQ